MAQHSEILLESGTNELEIIEFEIQGKKFGINVIKVMEIIQPLPATYVPHSHPFIDGIIQLRGEVLPVVSMKKALGIPQQGGAKLEQEKYIVTQFNKQKVVFHVDNVVQIHRISWEQIEKPSGLYTDSESNVIGVITMGEQIILLLDFEKMIVDINPEAGIHIGQVKKLGKRERSSKKIVVAEDSPLLRKLLNDTLSEAGYENLEFFENGRDALAYLESAAAGQKAIETEVQLVITDIEMPQMDGHHLTRRIKEENSLKKLPVIIFSSLITADLLHKGDMVGAQAQVSKPDIQELVAEIDKHIL